MTAPAAPGCHLLRLDTVNEGTAWFVKGRSEPTDVLLGVTGQRPEDGRRAPARECGLSTTTAAEEDA